MSEAERRGEPPLWGGGGGGDGPGGGGGAGTGPVGARAMRMRRSPIAYSISVKPVSVNTAAKVRINSASGKGGRRPPNFTDRPRPLPAQSNSQVHQARVRSPAFPIRK